MIEAGVEQVRSICAGHSMLCPFYNGVGSVKGHDGWGELEGSSGFLPQDLFLRC